MVKIDPTNKNIDFNNIFNNTQVDLYDEVNELHNTTGEEVLLDNNIISNIHQFKI